MDIAVIGVRLGAMLAAVAAARGADVRDLVLWGPAATGRSMLAELRAVRKMELFACRRKLAVPKAFRRSRYQVWKRSVFCGGIQAMGCSRRAFVANGLCRNRR